MINRAAGLTEVYERLKPLYLSYPLKFYGFSPDYTIDQNKLPAVIILEGIDDIIKRSTRGYIGYPAKRQLEVVVECWDNTLEKVRDLYQQCRVLVLAEGGILVGGEVIIRESKAVGPFNLDLPVIKGMRTIYLMNYTDDGPPT